MVVTYIHPYNKMIISNELTKEGPQFSTEGSELQLNPENFLSHNSTNGFYRNKKSPKNKNSKFELSGWGTDNCSSVTGNVFDMYNHIYSKNAFDQVNQDKIQSSKKNTKEKKLPPFKNCVNNVSDSKLLNFETNNTEKPVFKKKTQNFANEKKPGSFLKAYNLGDIGSISSKNLNSIENNTTDLILEMSNCNVDINGRLENNLKSYQSKNNTNYLE